MTARIIDGAAMSKQLLGEAGLRAALVRERRGMPPGLAIVIAGQDPASQVYIRNKLRACKNAGVHAQTFELPEDASEALIVDQVRQLNEDTQFDGVIVQIPLPDHVRREVVVEAIAPPKDVDGLHPRTLGQLVAGRGAFVPATPGGIREMLLRSGNGPAGKHVVICGRSELVGKPLALLLTMKDEGGNATVTLCHTGTRDLASFTLQADILVAAMGRPQAITADMIPDGVVIVDVGINRMQDSTKKSGYRLVGDVDFEAVQLKASAITPVPGGVGPMTVAMLIGNTVEAAQQQSGRSRTSLSE